MTVGDAAWVIVYTGTLGMGQVVGSVSCGMDSLISSDTRHSKLNKFQTRRQTQSIVILLGNLNGKLNDQYIIYEIWIGAFWSKNMFH